MVGLISGLVDTFNAPNFTGMLYNITPTDTKLLSAIGGLTGGGLFTAGMGDAALFAWQEEDLRSAGQNAALEGADAPAPTGRKRSPVFNVLQIIHETIGVSYTKLAAIAQVADVGSAHPQVVSVLGSQPVANEFERQLRIRMAEIARDVNWIFINGTFQEPADNLTARQTRGILDAITTNVIVGDAGAGAPEDLSKTLLFNLMQKVWENGGIMEQETATVLVNAWQRRKLTELFVGSDVYRQNSRTVGGVRVDTILTDFGELNVMMDRMMPTDQLAVVSLEWLAPVHLLVPGKGFLFVEPLGKDGSRDESQIYGEIGLMYGNERAHGKITNLTVTTV